MRKTEPIGSERGRPQVIQTEVQIAETLSDPSLKQPRQAIGGLGSAWLADDQLLGMVHVDMVRRGAAARCAKISTKIPREIIDDMTNADVQIIMKRTIISRHVQEKA